MNEIFNPSVIPFDASTNWPEPDMGIVSPDRPPAPEMDDAQFAMVFGPWAGWLKSAAEVKSAHVDYVALSLLCSASAVIGNARWAVPWEGWKEPPILWGMMVGEPSAGKSPAQDAILDPVKAIDDAFASEYRDARSSWDAEHEVASLVLSQWKSDAKSALNDGETPPAKPDHADAGAPPIRKRVRIVDATTEKVADLLSHSWRGLLLSRDELSGWLGSMDRYNGGGDRPFWLEAYGGRTYTVDRKSSPEPISVDHLTVAVMGGTQPDKLASLLVKCDDDGLLARFLTVFPDTVPLKRPTTTIDEQLPVGALQRLHALSPAITEDGRRRPFFLHLSEPARDALQAFRVDCRDWEQDAGGLMKSHIGKMPGMAVRVALVLALLDWCHESGQPDVSEITENHIGRACFYVGEHLRAHAYRAYGTSTPSPEIKLARKLAQIIQAEQPREINVREIQKRELAGKPDARAIKAACAILVEGDWLAPVTPPATAGRRRVSFAVNPQTGGAS